ncbi:Sugar phosphate isomerase/epimerase [Duganella sp. CF458]|uniref:sugar phosphate isomerase/epimerase family protein n=1 Tax=Duganella sp. CF458 TaxID=1884368 RepID=UPI0008E12640|nr:sugar phosphate isomerase/epimerase family protein [Duganella sp. CF458]SFG20909.1 Sugar phosphate isomerase/epimerase [Duganella sp. CF458]
MRLSISNIAWDTAEDEAVAELLKRYAVDAIDIAPGKYFPDPAKASEDDIAVVRSWWSSRGIELTGMQALLFGTSGLNVFGDASSQDAMLEHLDAVCRIGAGLGATRLVFGSPKNRDRSSLSDEQALAVAVPFFRRLGAIAQERGVTICLEPNPSCYGANFMTTAAETAAVVRAVAHPAVKMQFDTGALTINGEDPAQVLREYADLIGHLHASERNLVTLGDADTDHHRIGPLLAAALPAHVVTIEMVASNTEAHIVAIERALQCASKAYRDGITAQGQQ